MTKTKPVYTAHTPLALLGRVNNALYEFDVEQYTLLEWAERLGIKNDTLYKRLSRYRSGEYCWFQIFKNGSGHNRDRGAVYLLKEGLASNVDPAWRKQVEEYLGALPEDMR